MSYTTLHRAYTALGRHALLALTVATAALTACTDGATQPGAGTAIPQQAALAKVGGSEPIAFVSTVGGTTATAIALINSDGSRQKSLTEGPSDEMPAWSPDHRKLAITRYTGTQYEIFIRSANGPREELVGRGMDASWSPDGTRLVYTDYSNAEGNWDIYTMNVDGTDVRRITSDPAYDRHPHWSSDGQYIAFESYRDDYWNIFVVNAAGGDVSQQTFCGPVSDCLTPQWSPLAGDDRILFHRLDRPGIPGTSPAAIMLTSKSGSGFTLVLAGSKMLGGPVWSPDAQRVAFTGRFDDQPYDDLYTVNLDGTERTRVTFTPGTRDRNAAWAR